MEIVGSATENAVKDSDDGKTKIDDGENFGDIVRTEKSESSREEENSGKVSKESLNTLIVSLRPCIAQAKVHIIHQLARQVAGLKKKKSANENEKAKNERKIGRFVEEISILKRAKKDVISRWLVVNKKSFADVTKQETLTQKFNMKVRVFVRTGEHKAVKKVLDAYRVKYPNWESEVPKVLRTLGKKRKKTDPNKQELGIKAAKEGSTKVTDKDTSATIKQDSLENSEDNTSSESDSEDSDNDNAEVQSDDSDVDEGIVTTVTTVGHVSGTDDRASPEANSCDSDDEEIFVTSLKDALKLGSERSTRKVTAPVKGKREGSIEKKNGEVVVKVIDLNNADFDTVAGERDKSTEIKAADQNKCKKSSFFMGGESESEEEKDGGVEEDFEEDALQMRQESLRAKFQKEGRAGAGLNTRGGRADGGRGRGRERVEHSNRGRGRGDFVRGKGRGDFQKEGRGRIRDIQGGDRRKPGHSYSSSHGAPTVTEKSIEVDNNLHPSWAAKKRANTTITKFEGKKIKFGDDGVSSSNTKHTNDKPVSKGPVVPTPVEKLHPSWAAKQSQKSSIQTFQGKKVVFGD